MTINFVARVFIAVSVAWVPFLAQAQSLRASPGELTAGPAARFKDVFAWTGRYTLTITNGVGSYSDQFGTHEYNLAYDVVADLNLLRGPSGVSYSWQGRMLGTAIARCDTLTRRPDGSSMRQTAAEEIPISVDVELTMAVDAQETSGSFELGFGSGNLYDLYTPATARITQISSTGVPNQYGETYSLYWPGPFTSPPQASGVLPTDGFHLQHDRRTSFFAGYVCPSVAQVEWLGTLLLYPPGHAWCSGTLYDPELQCCIENKLQQKYPIVDLAACPNRKQRVDPASNGCGTKERRLPEGLGRISWRSVCDDHDQCYATCGSVKEQCDTQFGPGLAKRIGVWAGNFPLLAAEAGLVSFGAFALEQQTSRQAWEDAQKESCQCCE